jgi:hypothetical protein
LGIWCEVYTFIRPKGSYSEKFLLLGLPWLYDVRATFDIQGSRLNIRDFKCREKYTCLEGLKFQLLTSYKLLLVPTDKRYQKVIAIAEASISFTESILPDPDYSNFVDSDSNLTDSGLDSEDDYKSVSDSASIASEN